MDERKRKKKTTIVVRDEREEDTNLIIKSTNLIDSMKFYLGLRTLNHILEEGRVVMKRGWNYQDS